MLRSWTPFQFSAIFYHFISHSQLLIPHLFPYALLGSPPNHLTSHLIDHLTIPQSTITCHYSAVCSIPQHHHLPPFGLPAHDAPLRSCQLMMELYLELPHHDEPYYMLLSLLWLLLLVTFSFVYKPLYFWWLGPKPNLVFNPRLVASTQDSKSHQPELLVASKFPWSSTLLIIYQNT